MYSDDYPRKRRRVDQHVSTPAPLVVHQSRLYFDIFNEILKHVERVDSATLMNLCLVSKEWWYLAERKLYWYPQLKSLRSIEQLVRSLKGNVTLQDFIHSISFTLNMDISSQTDTTLTSQQRDGTCFLLRLQKLEHITLQGSCAHHVLPLWVNLPARNRVKSINIFGPEERTVSHSGFALPWISSPGESLSTLRELQLSNVVLVPSQGISAPSVNKLEVLVMNRCSFVGDATFLMSGELSSLRRLFINCRVEEAKSILRLCKKAHQLRELSVFSFDSFDSILKQPLPSLRHLVCFLTQKAQQCIPKLFPNLEFLVDFNRADYQDFGLSASLSSGELLRLKCLVVRGKLRST